MAIDKWKSYLQVREFTIKADHKSLLYLTEQRVCTKLQHKALLKLMDLQCKIAYKKRVTNTTADALSRMPSTSSILAVSSCTPIWQENLKQGYAEDLEAKQLLAELAIVSPNDKGFSLHDGLITFQGRIWIVNNSLAQQYVIQALHSNGIGVIVDFMLPITELRPYFLGHT